MKNIYTYVLTCLLALNAAPLSFAAETGQREKEQLTQASYNTPEHIKALQEKYPLDESWRNLAFEQEIELIKSQGSKEELVQKIDEYHLLILSIVEKNPKGYEAFIKKSKEELFFNHKQAWASLDGIHVWAWWDYYVSSYGQLESICHNLTPNCNARKLERYENLFVRWNTLPSYIEYVGDDGPDFDWYKDRHCGERSSYDIDMFVGNINEKSNLNSMAKLDNIWRNVYVEPAFTNLSCNQKMSKYSLPNISHGN